LLQRFDVAVIGGGPAGSTAAAFLKKYSPDLSVAVYEREKFPRDHVGESLLPLINEYLVEAGVWDKVEAADFPVKIGATYRWGATPDLWNFEFLPEAKFEPMARPSRYEGQRTSTSFQVDRAIYDKILLDHARDLGCEVYEEAKITKVLRSGDAVTGLVVETEGAQRQVSARFYIDASGASGILRRALEVNVESPTQLRNIAIWDYWKDAEWPIEIGVGGTRIQVLSLGYGWLWFIPIGTDRTSVGFVVPADYAKKSGKRPNELYAEAISGEPRLTHLLRHAKSEGPVQTTNDWSFTSERLAGENWFLAGDTCGFADPILSAGCTLAQGSGREVAYVILELLRNEHDAVWLKSSFEETHKRRIQQHIRFADYWYSANGQFSDLVAYCSEIAESAGLDLNPDEAFRWLGTGGFANDDLGQPSVGAYSLTAAKRLTQMFSGKDASWRINSVNEVRLDLREARLELRPYYLEGRIHAVEALVKGAKTLPLTGPFRLLVDVLNRTRDLREIAKALKRSVPQEPSVREQAYYSSLMALEALLEEGWAIGRQVSGKPPGLGLPLTRESATIRLNPPESSG
jgi:flavin-dependent dehydrogenase